MTWFEFLFGSCTLPGNIFFPYQCLCTFWSEFDASELTCKSDLIDEPRRFTCRAHGNGSSFHKL